jgi:hypothetical protein
MIKPFICLLIIDLIAVVLIFLFSTMQQSGGSDVEFLVNGIEYLIKAHLIISLSFVFFKKWAVTNIVFVVICIVVGLIPFIISKI